jgi:photosystem II stability/assembly factor-like uncharacterized protein
MKLLTVFLLALLLSSGIKANAQILMDENFSGAVGDSLTNYGWVSFSGGSTNFLRVTTPGLTYAGYPLSGIANATTVLNSGQDAYKQFTADSSGVIYVSYMLRVDSIRTGDYFAAMLPNNSTSNFAARMWAKDTTGGYRIGLSKSSASATGPIVYSNSVYTLGTTYLIVLKYQFNTGTTTDDVMSMYIFNSGFPVTEPGVATIPNVTGSQTDSPNLARFALRQGTAASSPNVTVDGIRVAKTWANLVSVYNCIYAWAPQVSGTTSALNSVKAVSPSIVWAGGVGATVRRTTDGGTTWLNANPNPGVINGDIYAIEALDANTAWATTSPAATFVYKTTNGGTNWTQVFTQAGGFMNGIVFRDANNGFIQGDPVGGRWSLFRTTDGGNTWDSTGLFLPQNATEAGWNNAVILLGNTIWMGTNNTRVYKSTNFGLTWTFSATTGTTNSYGVAFNDGSNGIAGGTNIVRSTDGGATFTGIGTAPGTGNILGMDGEANNFWYLRGTGIFRSSNYGANFTQVYTASASQTDVDFINVGGCLHGWSVGASGTIIKMRDSLITGVTNNYTEVPNEYRLEQNYPNPFNPATTINFALPVAGHVVLKIYDVTGKEAAVLVNDFRQQGSHSVNFNAAGLSSGIYFYTLKAGDFVSTRRMVLLK